MRCLPLVLVALALAASSAAAAGAEHLDTMPRQFGGRPFHGYFVNIAIEETLLFQVFCPSTGPALRPVASWQATQFTAA